MDNDIDPIKSIIDSAIGKSRTMLTEFESINLLSSRGIKFPSSRVARDIDDAVLFASAFKTPVVLKAHGDELAHKTDVKGVSLRLTSPQEVRREGSRILNIPGCKGLLVEEYIQGERELVCGFFRDPNFGPTIMFGIGGVLTEIINDVSFRLAPLDNNDVKSLIEDIRSKKILDEFRGQRPADMKSLKAILLALSDIGTSYEDISEIDINPIIIQQDGSPIAVDALVVLDPK